MSTTRDRSRSAPSIFTEFPCPSCGCHLVVRRTDPDEQVTCPECDHEAAIPRSGGVGHDGPAKDECDSGPRPGMMPFPSDLFGRQVTPPDPPAWHLVGAVGLALLTLIVLVVIVCASR